MMDMPKNNCEGTPLNSGSTNIFFGKTNKLNSDGTVIQLNTKENSAEVGVHINTTLAFASSKKIKLLFVLNFLFCIICMALSSSVGVYCWNEMSSMRRQLDVMKDHVLMQNIKSNQERIMTSALVNPKQEPTEKETKLRHPKQVMANGKRYYVEDLGEDVLLRDLNKKKLDSDKPASPDLSANKRSNDIAVIHFNGGLSETNLLSQTQVGPWVLDSDISTNNSEEMIELNTTYFTVKQSGVYMIYAQMVYLSKLPNCYFIFARQPDAPPRQVGACATGDDSSARAPARSQMSCGVHAVARLRVGDTVNMVQREPNRTVWLRPGYTYFGFIKLSS